MQYPKRDINIDDLREIPEYSNVSEEEGMRIIETLKTYAQVLFDQMIRIKGEPPDIDF